MGLLYIDVGLLRAPVCPFRSLKHPQSSAVDRVRVSLTFEHMSTQANLERRTSARVRTDVPVIAHQNGVAQRMRAVDLSSGGALFQRRGDRQPPMFQRVELLLRVRSLLRIRALETRLERSNSVIRRLESALRSRTESEALLDAHV